MIRIATAIAVACAVGATAAPAAYITYDIGTYLTGTQYNYSTNVSTPITDLGSYSFTLDLSKLSNITSNPTNYYFATSPTNVTINTVNNQIGFNFIQVGAVTSIRLTLRPGSFSNGITSNIFTGEIVSSSISVDTALLNLGGIVLNGNPVVTSLGTRITQTGTEGVTGDLFLNAVTVPEPASWAMMIAGFGIVGASMRRRKVVVAFA